MLVFFQLLFRIFSFAVFVTGTCGLLNYLFDLHLTLEGTEAPAEFELSILLMCFATTLGMWGEIVGNNHYVVKYTKKWYNLILYLLVSILLFVFPAYFFYTEYENYNLLHEALVENDLEEFQNKENLKRISQKKLERIFSEAIRRNSPEITQIVSEFLQDVNGEPKSPNVFLAAYRCNPKVFEILIQKKANFSMKENYMGSTVLHSIVTGNGNISDKSKVIRMLVEENLSDIDGVDNFQATPLMNAVERGEYDLVETLLSLKADLKKVDHVGNPVLMRVCEKSSLNPDLTEEARIKTIKVLLKNGADKNAKDYLGRDCREMAERDGFKKLAEIF
ncbi:MAG: ankyrin repeat domain-containing protein [Leptospiraceae bacterium]|nr:ankyrin repeat domain-containing protein [Leptospiraceae bacterium]